MISPRPRVFGGRIAGRPHPRRAASRCPGAAAGGTGAAYGGCNGPGTRGAPRPGVARRGSGPVQQLAAEGPDDALAEGVHSRRPRHGKVVMTRSPSAMNTSPNAVVNSGSRSWIRNRSVARRSPRFMARFRACCAAMLRLGAQSPRQRAACGGAGSIVRAENLCHQAMFMKSRLWRGRASRRGSGPGR